MAYYSRCVKSVSYTHLDVYKRQRVDSLYIRAVSFYHLDLKAHIAVFIYAEFGHVERKLLHLGRPQEGIGLFPDLPAVYSKAQHALVNDLFRAEVEYRF